MNIQCRAIGFVKTDAPTVPRHWTLSTVGGEIIIHEKYTKGLQDIQRG